MPEVSRFYGISIFLYPREHPPAHFHALYSFAPDSLLKKSLLSNS